MKNKNFLKKLTAIVLGFVMTLGVGAAGYAGGVSSAEATAATYTHDFTAKPASSGDISLSSVTWIASNATNLISYNSSNYKGVQLGTSSETGSYTLTSKYAWGKETSATRYYGNEKIVKVYLWMNAGASGSISATVSIGGYAATSDGTTVEKNSSASSQRSGTTKVTYTPATGHDTGVIVINYTKGTVKQSAGYFCSIQVECDVNVSKVTATYNANGGTVSPTTSGEVSPNTEITIPTPSKTGSTFDGWQIDGTGSYIQPGSYTLTQDTTFVAHWTVNTYSVTGSIDNGSLSDSGNATYGVAFDRYINPNVGYGFPSSISVTINSSSSSDFNYNSSTGEITIAASYVVGPIAITATCPIKTYSVFASITNGYISPTGSITYHSSYSGTITPSSGYSVPDAKADISVTIGGSPSSDFIYSNGVVSIDGQYVIGDINISASCVAVFSISASCVGGSVDPSSDTTIKTGGTALIQFVADSTHVLPVDDTGFTVTNADIVEYASGLLEIGNATGNVTVVCTCIEAGTRNITVSMSNVTNVTGAGTDVIEIGGGAVVTMDAASGYRLPIAHLFTVTGAYASFEYSTNKHVTITLSNCTDNVDISGAPVRRYGITTSITNGSAEPSSGEVDRLKLFHTTLSPNSGYKLPSSISVTVDGEPCTDDYYTYNASTGEISIQYVSGETVISASMQQLLTATISVSGSGTYSDQFTYSGDTSIVEDSTATVTITPAASYSIDAENITVTNATKVSYVNNVLTISNPTSSNVNISVAPQLKTITSIAVTTNPTKTSYIIGETFSFAGGVVTGYYNGVSSDNVDVTSDCTFTFSDPEAMLKAGTPSVTITYTPTNVTTTYQITVAARQIETTTTYDLVNPSTLIAGDKIVIAAADYDYALSTTQNGNNRGQASIKKDTVNNRITWANDAGVQVLTLTAGSVDGSFGFYTGSGYLYAASSSSNCLKTRNDLDANASWKLSASTSDTTITAQGSNTRKLLYYNKNSSIFSCYGSAQGKVCIYKEVKHSTGTASLAGLTATYTRATDHYVGESVLKDDLFVKAWYDTGDTKDSTNDSAFKNAYTITNPTLSSTSNDIVLSYTDNSVTKTCTVVVPAVQQTKVVEHVYIEQVQGSPGYKTEYIDDGVTPLTWDLTNLCAAVYWSDDSRTEISIPTLVNYSLSPSVPRVGVTSFSVSGSYLGVEVDSGHNTVSGISVVAKAISNLETWSLSSGFSFTVYEGDAFDFDKLGSVKITWNDGTVESGQNVKSLLDSGKVKIGLFENYSGAATPDIELTSSSQSFTWDRDYNDYKMALISTLNARTRKDTLFTVNYFNQTDLNAVSSNIGMAYKYTDNGGSSTKEWVEYNGTQTIADGTKIAILNEFASDPVSNYALTKASGLTTTSSASVNLSNPSFGNLETWIVDEFDSDTNLFHLKMVDSNQTYYLQGTNDASAPSATTTYSSGDAQLFAICNLGTKGYGVRCNANIGKSSERALIYRSGYNFKNYATTNVGANGYGSKLKVYVYSESCRFTNVDFRFKLQFNGITTFANNNEAFSSDYGLKVEYGENEFYFSVKNQGIYELDGTKVTDLTYLGTANNGYFVLKLGDVINEMTKAAVEFTITPYVIGGNGKEYLSTSVTTYSVMSIVEHYHNDPATSKAASVIALYNIFFAEEE